MIRVWWDYLIGWPERPPWPCLCREDNWHRGGAPITVRHDPHHRARVWEARWYDRPRLQAPLDRLSLPRMAP